MLQIHEPGQTPEPHARDTAAIGIDLGTTHSVVAFADGDGTHVLADADGTLLIPSVVQYRNDTVIAGKPALEALRAGKPGVIASIKRLMGRGAGEIMQGGGQLPYTIEETDGALSVATSQGLKNPIEISAEILRLIRHIAEAALEKPVTQAVITVPAYFDEAARSATKAAARLAGLEVLRLINEPTAAALAYGLDHGREGVYAVYDLGGGTFDLSILKLEGGVFQVLATAGDTALGGDDFDQAIATLLRDRHPTIDDIAPYRLLSVAREVKERLSTADQAKYELGAISGTITRVEFESAIAPLIERTLSLAMKSLQDANVTADVLQGIVMVGGSTRVPLVQHRVSERFGLPLLNDVDPDQVVAVGAALQARGLTQGSDHLLLDVTPLSLGLETMGDLVEKIIHRNTPIPTSATQQFTTYKDGQTAMLIHVLQGEREMVGQNRSLARFTLSGIPPLPAGIARIDVTFTIDADGLLSVAAREVTTGIEQHVDIRPSFGLPPEKIEQMLRDSMENARADITERLLAETRFEARRLIEEINSALRQSPDLLGADEREALSDAMGELSARLAESDRDRIDQARQKLEQAAAGFAQRRMDSAIQSALKGTKISEDQ